MWRLHFNGSESEGSELQICVPRGSSCISFLLRSFGVGEGNVSSYWTLVKCQHYCPCCSAVQGRPSVGCMGYSVWLPTTEQVSVIEYSVARDLRWGWDKDWEMRWVLNWYLILKVMERGKSNYTGFWGLGWHYTEKEKRRGRRQKRERKPERRERKKREGEERKARKETGGHAR